MNDLDFCLEVESRSCQPLRCIQRSLSRKPLVIVAWFQETTNKKNGLLGIKCGARQYGRLSQRQLAFYFYFFLLFLMCHYAVNWCDKLRLPLPIGGPL